MGAPCNTVYVESVTNTARETRSTAEITKVFYFSQVLSRN